MAETSSLSEAEMEDKGGGKLASLTPIMYRFMLALQRRMDENASVAPTYDELRKDMGLASKSSVSRLVIECEQRGRIRRIPNRDRSIVILHPVDIEVSMPPEADLLESFTDAQITSEMIRRGILKMA